MKSQFSMLVASGAIATFLGTLAFYLWTTHDVTPVDNSSVKQEDHTVLGSPAPSHAVFDVPLTLDELTSFFTVDRIYTENFDYPFSGNLKTNYHFQKGEKVDVLYVELTAKRKFFSDPSSATVSLRCLGTNDELLAEVRPVFLVRAPVPKNIYNSFIDWNGGEKGLLVVALPRIAKRAKVIVVEFSDNVFSIE